MTTTTPSTNQPSTAEVRAAWDRLAPRFDQHVTPANLASAERLLRRHGVGPGSRLVDVAAGSGGLAVPAARLGADVMATDLSPVMLQRLTQRAARDGLSVETRAMDALDLDLPDDAFDFAVSQHGVSLLPDMARGLREMARVTRPGGRVLIVAFGPLARAEFLTFFFQAVRAVAPDYPGLPAGPPPPFQVADPEQLRRKMAGAGLADVVVESDGWELRIRSADHLWDIVTSSNPIGAAAAGGLSPDQAAAVMGVLEGMLRDRADGPDQPAVLHVALNLGAGTA